MAYNGSTASSSVANPPRQMVQSIGANHGTTGLTTAPGAPGAQGGGLWFYCSTNLTTDLVVAGFFSDGENLGMRPGDMVFGMQFSSAGSSVTSFMGAVTGITTAGAASLSTGSLVTSTFA